MKTVYVETSIPSYVVARMPADIVPAARQYLAQQWWYEYRDKFRCVISDIVLLEASRGDADLATKRLALLKGMERLADLPAVRCLAADILKAHALPEKASEDALHLAFAIYYEVNILLTWNCRHIANPFILSQIRKLVESRKLFMPEVVTPEELLGGCYES